MAPTQQQKKTRDRTLGAIVSHPLRARCLTVLAERTASPAELAIELKKPVGDVSYHVTTLLRAGVIELVDQRPVRGAVEHFYRAVARPLLSDDEVETHSLEERLAFARQAFQLATADATNALETKTFAKRSNHHISRVPMSVDEEGWEELVEVYREALDKVIEIQAACAERRANGQEGEDIPITAFTTFFEVPPRGPGGKS